MNWQAIQTLSIPPTMRPKQAVQMVEEKTGVTLAQLSANGWAGALTPLVHNPHVRDIIIPHAGQVLVRSRDGTKSEEPIHLTDEWIRFLATIWGKARERDLIERNNHVFRDTLLFADVVGGIRYAYAPNGVSAYGSSLYIRRLPTQPIPLTDLIRNQTVPAPAADMLRSFMRVGTPLIISGQTGSGKTTLLGALVAELQAMTQPFLNLLIVERSHEIPLNHRAYRWEEAAGVSLAHLAEKATQMGLEWLVLGECTGGEAYFVAKAFRQGVPAMTTLHADSGKSAFKQLALLALEYVKDPRLLTAVLREMSTQGLVSVHLSLKEGEQGLLGRVSEICELVGLAGEEPVVNKLWQWDDEQKQLVWQEGSVSQLSSAMQRRYRVAGEMFPVPQETKKRRWR